MEKLNEFFPIKSIQKFFKRVRNNFESRNNSFIIEQIKAQNEILQKDIEKAKDFMSAPDFEERMAKTVEEIKSSLTKIIEKYPDKKPLIVIGGKSSLILKILLQAVLSDCTPQAQLTEVIKESVRLSNQENKDSYLGWWSNPIFQLDSLESLKGEMHSMGNNLHLIGIDDHGVSFGKGNGFLKSCELSRVTGSFLYVATLPLENPLTNINVAVQNTEIFDFFKTISTALSEYISLRFSKNLDTLLLNDDQIAKLKNDPQLVGLISARKQIVKESVHMIALLQQSMNPREQALQEYT